MDFSLRSTGRRSNLRSGLGAAVAVAVVGLVAVAPAVARSPSGPGSSPAQAATFDLEPVLSGYDRPLYVTSDGRADRLFIVEQTGRIKVATRSDTTSPWQKAGVFLDLRGPVHDPPGDGSERGLLGLAFHPDYLDNQLFYVYYTRESDDRNVLVEYERRTSLVADPTSARVVFSIAHGAAPNHNGGWIAFGPDGYLYVAMGDGGGGQSDNAQDLRSRHGKILRLDPTDPPGSRKFTVPADNPFVGVPGKNVIWSYGLRNPWRNSFDSETGDLWIADVGEQKYEEVNRADAPAAGRGDDYGWDLCEGDHRYTGTKAECGPGPSTTVRPVAEYEQPTGCSVTGGYVYRGADQPSLDGSYFFGDFCGGQIWAIPDDFDDPSAEALPPPFQSGLNVSSFGVDGRGELYVVHLGGSIHLVVED